MIHSTYPAIATLAAAASLTMMPSALRAKDTSPTPAQIMQGALSQVGLDAATLATPDPDGPTVVSIDFFYTLSDAEFEAQMNGSAAFRA